MSKDTPIIICPHCGRADGYFMKMQINCWAVMDEYGRFTGDEGEHEVTHRFFKRKYCLNCDKEIK